jgi:hypothetical protein
VNTKDFIPVCGVVVTLVYGWSLYRFLWVLTGWVNYLTAEEITGIFFYSLTVSLVDSSIVLFTLVGLSFLLPPKWLRDHFVFRGSFSALYILIFAMYLTLNTIPLDQLGVQLLVALVGLVFLHLVVGRFQRLRLLIEAIADRSIVFLYIYIPLSVLGIISVIIRNIW